MPCLQSCFSDSIPVIDQNREDVEVDQMTSTKMQAFITERPKFEDLFDVLDAEMSDELHFNESLWLETFRIILR